MGGSRNEHLEALQISVCVVEGDLIQAMLTNPHLQIEVENGLYDLATDVSAR